MKKIFLLLFLFVLAKTGYCQFPITQYLGSDSAIVKSRGGLQGRFAPIPFTDTAQANTSRISQYPGALIYTSGVDKYWYRNSSATGWIELASSSSINIYNSDGSLTGNRQVLGGASYNLTFDGMQLFGVTASSISLTSGISTVNISDSVVFDNTQGFSIRTLSSDDDTTTYKPLGYDPVTGKVVTRSSWVGGGGGTPTLQEVLATESNIAIIDNTDILPSTSGLDLVFGDAGSTLWNDIVLKGDGTVQMEAQTSTNSKSSLFGVTPDSVQINAYLGQINIDSLRSWAGTTISDTAYKKVMTWDTRNGRVEYSNWLGAGGGGSGTVTSVGTGYGLSGGTITTSGTLLLDSATVANYFMRRKDSLTTSNALGYVTKTTLADTAAALRSLTSYITIDKRYDSLAWRRNDSTFLVKSLRLQLNGSDITATKTDSTVSYNILASTAGLADSMVVVRARYDRSYDTIVKVNDSTVVWRRFDNTADTVQFHAVSSSVDTTTVPLITFTTGAGFAADTAMVTDSSLFGSLFTGQYEYTIKQIQAVIKGNSGDSIVLKLVYNDTFNVDGTKINGAGFSLNNRFLGNTVTVSTNRTAASNTWLWLKPEAVISGKKPKYISVTLLGYKTYIAP